MRYIALFSFLLLSLSACQRPAKYMFGDRIPQTALFAMNTDAASMNLTPLPTQNASRGVTRGLSIASDDFRCLAMTPECLGYDPVMWNTISGNLHVSYNPERRAFLNLLVGTSSDKWENRNNNRIPKIIVNVRALDGSPIDVINYRASDIPLVAERPDNKPNHVRVVFRNKRQGRAMGLQLAIRKEDDSQCRYFNQLPQQWWSFFYFWDIEPPSNCGNNNNFGRDIEVSWRIQHTPNATQQIKEYTGKFKPVFKSNEYKFFHRRPGSEDDLKLHVLGWTSLHEDEYGHPIMYNPYNASSNGMVY